MQEGVIQGMSYIDMQQCSCFFALRERIQGRKHVMPQVAVTREVHNAVKADGYVLEVLTINVSEHNYLLVQPTIIFGKKVNAGAIIWRTIDLETITSVW